ncbi:GNAT family N-acetyltransferase [Thauera sp.]|jgi:predicted GNAT family N-acyltransferase|uniref:GNAT family N-acetyltransferase n=1 Tax=Thauera sp. TaxID=1905334 RepID=UPI002C2276E8|nr:GNAT family N-acetyltransferase [Thauera sp.]HRO35584.1 GNAT family N-acetyltransferase [Thauera sp.]
MKDLEIEVVGWDEAELLVMPVRTEVFVVEQGVPAEIERDALDAVCRHAIARDAGGRVVATGRLLPDGHIGRMAVRRAARGAGVGGAVLQALIAEAARRGLREVALAAQTHALDFYLRHGFEAVGEVFMEAGIPHRAMRRTV